MGNERPEVTEQEEYRFPAEYEPHEGTLLIWPERPGSWGIEPTEAEEAFARLIREILWAEDVHLLTGKNGKERVTRYFPLTDEEPCAEKTHTGEPDAEGTGAEKTYAGEPGAEKIGSALINGHRLLVYRLETNDSWARDIGPTFLLSGDGRNRLAVNWRFNAWGGEVDGLYADWEKDDAAAGIFSELLGDPVRDAVPFVLEGGSIHTDGEGTLLVTEACLLSAGRNPGLSKEEIEERLIRTLGVKKVLWLPRGIIDDETNEHVDNVAAFIGPAEVVLAWTDDPEDPQYPLSEEDLHYLSSVTDAKGRKIRVHKLPIPKVPVCYTEEETRKYSFEPGEDTREPGERLAASYVNFYFANGRILLPAFGGENEESDRLAAETMRRLCPDREIISIPARKFILGGGNIHCLTQQIPAVSTGER